MSSDRQRQKAALDLFHATLVGAIQAMSTRFAQMTALPAAEETRLLNTLGLVRQRPSSELLAAASSLMIQAARLLEQPTEWRLWMQNLAAYIELNGEQGLWANVAHLCLLLGLQEQRLGQWGAAEGLYERARARFAELDEGPAAGYALARLAYLNRLQGRLAAAVDLAEQALRVLPADRVERHLALFAQGMAALDRGDAESAIRLLEASLAVCQAHGDGRLAAMRHRALGWAYTVQGALEPAQAHLWQSIEMFQEMGDLNELALSQMNLGIVFSKQGEPERALDFYAAAQPIFRQLHDRPNLALLYNNQGMEYRQLERWTEAEHAFAASMALHEQLGNRRSLLNVQSNLGELYVAAGRPAEAMVVLQAALQQIDALEPDARLHKLQADIAGDLAQAARMNRETGAVVGTG